MNETEFFLHSGSSVRVNEDDSVGPNASDVAKEGKRNRKLKEKFIQISHYSALEFPYQMFVTRCWDPVRFFLTPN